MQQTFLDQIFELEEVTKPIVPSIFNFRTFSDSVHIFTYEDLQLYAFKLAIRF